MSSSNDTPTAMGSHRRLGFWRANSLSLVFGGLLLLALAGQAVAGWADYNEQARTAAAPEVTLLAYVQSTHYAVDVTENWQSEFLQFTLYILLTIWLVQRGSAESKRASDRGRESDEKQRVGAFARPDSPSWVRAGGWRTALYSHSLTLAMTAVFTASWTIQGITGWVAENERRMRDLLDPDGFTDYVAGADFWDRTLQNWQSELLAIGAMAVFSIYLRERGSPESKPVGAPHDETGRTG